ncbi:MAG: nucleoside triphosphate pyrophosphohydrolase [Candidatus Thorarchaeota archaeon]|nr:nucleoside triphosphate pyrophosphohydrolase [Candidatus Thorarchaeota archaeon]
MAREKLVRDRIPDLIRSSGQTPVVRTALKEELDHLLRLKVLEEAEELFSSGSNEELADIVEAVLQLAKTRGISREQLDLIVAKKRADRGGFEMGYVLTLPTEED